MKLKQLFKLETVRRQVLAASYVVPTFEAMCSVRNLFVHLPA